MFSFIVKISLVDQDPQIAGIRQIQWSQPFIFIAELKIFEKKWPL